MYVDKAVSRDDEWRKYMEFILMPSPTLIVPCVTMVTLNQTKTL